MTDHSYQPTNLEKELAPGGHRNPWKPLLLILLLAAVLRICWTVRETALIENEGAEYAQIAKNLVAGRGYVGLRNVPQIWFPPLYPMLIAAFSLATADFDIAARLVSLTVGSCLVIPVFFIALGMYGRRVAYISASLIAFHPLLIALSGSVYSEVVFLTVLMAGVYWAEESLRFKNARSGILCGVCLGLAYLTRPEGIALPVLVSASIIVAALLQKTTQSSGNRLPIRAGLICRRSYSVRGFPFLPHRTFSARGQE
jgi:4-amino-4-deoxy-L-arabinose transferase-like glycosyltransferase